MDMCHDSIKDLRANIVLVDDAKDKEEYLALLVKLEGLLTRMHERYDNNPTIIDYFDLFGQIDTVQDSMNAILKRIALKMSDNE